MNQYIFEALILGLVGGIIPGPILAATFTEILQSGFVKSLRIILWGMLTETVVALVSLVILSSLGLSLSVFHVLSIFGAGILLWIAYSIWKINSIDTNTKVHFGFGKISAMIIANGVLWTFWITVCIPKAVALNATILFGQYIFLILVEVGWLISTVAVAYIFSRFRNLLSSPRIISVTFRIFAILFVYFAGDMIYKSVKYFIN